MSLASGTRLGPYEIVSQIGAGGMGEVYKATDTRLQRTIAIKVLPEDVASDPQRRQRFEREAKAVSSLNHPHICILHDVGVEDGTHYLVMELVEGETLEATLERGRLPLDKALEYAIQIADALDKAHRQGVVHRDLKPANIMLTRSGVKLLDFGLVKLKGEAGAVSPMSQMPTQDAGLTAEGTILGTLQYMAPEQLEGKDADARADTFAFGAIVYEMVTGKKAFEGKSQASLISSIMSSQPQPMSELLEMTPRSLDHVVKRCLEKDPDDRWQAASDVMREVQWAREPVSEQAVGSRATPRQLPIAWASGLAVVTLVAVVLGVLLLLPQEAVEMRLDVVTPATSDVISLAVSPDGRQLAFVGLNEGTSLLWLRRLNSETAEPLTGTEGASFPFWSPDSRSVGFFANGQLNRIDLDGGLIRSLAEAPAGAGGAWGPNGVILYTPFGGATVTRVPSTGGASSPVVTSPFDTNNTFPQFLPDGRQFLFHNFTFGNAPAIYLGSLDSPEAKLLVEADSTGMYHPSGYLLFLRQSALMAQRFDPGAGEVMGNAVPVADGVALDALLGGGAFSVSSSGTLAYRKADSRSSRLTWFDREGQAIGNLGDAEGTFLAPSIAPDGGRVAVTLDDGETWMIDVDNTSPSQFTFGRQSIFHAWSPDGLRIAYADQVQGLAYEKSSSGAGLDQLLLDEQPAEVAPILPTDWSPDGGTILYTRLVPPNIDIWTLSMEGEEREARPYLADPDYTEHRAAFSRNGRWIAYQSSEQGPEEIYVRPFPDPDQGLWRISTTGGVNPRWSDDGQELYYLTSDGALMAVAVDTASEIFSHGPPVELFQTRLPGSLVAGVVQPYDVSADGRFLMPVPAGQGMNPITLLLNWEREEE